MSLTALKWAFSIPGITGNEKCILIALAWHHDGRIGECAPSVRLIATETCRHTNTVLAGIDGLKAARLIDVLPPKGHKLPQRYVLNMGMSAPVCVSVARTQKRKPSVSVVETQNGNAAPASVSQYREHSGENAAPASVSQFSAVCVSVARTPLREEREDTLPGRGNLSGPSLRVVGGE